MRQLLNLESIAVAKCLKSIGADALSSTGWPCAIPVSELFYSDEHPQSLKVDGVEKPRRKRGRPRKQELPPPTTPPRTLQETTQVLVVDSADGKQRRRRKAPSRFQEAVQGVELEKMYREVGVTDDEYIPSGTDPEVIGHIETKAGDELGEIMVINKSNCTPKSVQRKIIQFSCELCHLTFSQEGKFLKHQESHLRSEWMCETCGEKLPDEKALEGHQATAHNKAKQGEGDYPCDDCERRFHHPSSVKYHNRTEHSSGQRYVCSKCNKAFKHKQLLRRHQLVHTDARPFLCHTCNASFKTKSNLMNHITSHSGVKKFNCHLCGQQFLHKTSLKFHLRWHAGVKPFTCDVCSKSFTQKGNLQEHMRIHTGEKPFECNICSRRFTTSSQYKLHLKRHAGVKPWECNFCKKSFLQKETWKYHVRRHLGVKPFKCDICQRDFPGNWALKKHMRLHTGEKPFSCPVCSKSFSDYSNLVKHKKTHLKNLDKSQITFDKTELANKLDDKDSLLVAKRDDAPQVIYVTYQDPDDPNTKVSRKYLVGPGAEISNLETENQAIDDPDSMQFLDEFGNPLQITLQDGTEIHLMNESETRSLIDESEESELIPVHLITSEGCAVTAQIAPVFRLANIVNVGDESIEGLDEGASGGVELIAPDGGSVEILEALPSSPSTFLNNLTKGELFS